jgi:hypothetical protein
MTINISKLLAIPNLEVTMPHSGMVLGAAHKHRLLVRDFALRCEISIKDANFLIDYLIEHKYVERYIFRGENWVRTTSKVSNNNN